MVQQVITLLAYKSDSVDICRGCVMARYSPDFKYIGSANKELITSFLADILFANKHLDHGESGYEITFLFNGEEFPEEPGFETEGMRNELTRKAEVIVTAKLAEEQRVKTETDRKRQAAAQAAKEKEERQQLATLMEKYEVDHPSRQER